MSLEICDISLRRGTKLLQTGLSFRLTAGESLWVKGANGVGKSTLLATLCGFRNLDLQSRVLVQAGNAREDKRQGQIFWRGQNIRHHLDQYHADLAYIGHKNGNTLTLKCGEVLVFHGRLLGAGRDRIAQALERMKLEKVIDVPVHMLSAGQQKRLALARLILSEALLWVLDEPATSLDEEGRELLGGLCSAHLNEGGLMVYTSHIDLNMPDLKLWAKSLQLNPLDRDFVGNDDAFTGQDWRGME